MENLNRKQLRALLGSRAFKFYRRQASGEKLTFQERRILNIALKKAKKK